MSRTIRFSNRSLDKSDILKILKTIDKNEDVDTLEIDIRRDIKINKFKISDQQVFTKIKDFVNYLDEFEIDVIQEIEIKILYIDGNAATLEYEKLLAGWEVSYLVQDKNIDSFIYNVRPVLSATPLSLIREYRPHFIIIYAIIYLFFLWKLDLFWMNCISITIFAFLVADGFIYKNVAYRNDNFFTRNKDSLIISFVSYILGAITPYLIDIFWR